MEKSTFEQMDGTYRQEGDYLLPNLTVPESTPVGIWGQRRRRYLKEHRQALYTALLLSGKLNDHLSEINVPFTFHVDKCLPRYPLVKMTGIPDGYP